MLRSAWVWLFGTPRVSEREAFLEAIQLLVKSQTEQQKTMQAWLGMFTAANQSPRGWVADEESQGIKEQAAARNLQVPPELLTGSEAERIDWLTRQMESDD